MSYTKLITEDNPTIIWPLDDLFGSTSGSSNSINFTSASSYRALINITNTFYGKQPLVYGAKNSACIETTAVGISVPALGMLSEYSKNRSYSIEFWMRWSKVPPTEEKIMIRKGTTTNGVFIKGSNIIFRCGDEDKYVETSQVVKNVDNPTHIVIRYSESSIELIVNGQFSSTEIDSPIYENVDVNHNTNDFIDFYGLTGALVYYDAIAIYPRKLSTYSALRHYMYGVGHSVEEETFSSRGGEFYNISLAQTKPSYFKTLVTYDDFNFISTVNYENIYHNENGMRINNYAAPVFYSSDGKITKSASSILFSSSAGNTEASFIDIPESAFLINEVNGIKTFFTKLQISGELPDKLSSQTLLSISEQLNVDLIRFDLYNNSVSSSPDSYQLVVRSDKTSGSIAFNLTSLTSSPSFWLGVGFTDKTLIYFGNSLSGSFITASYITASLDPLIMYSNRIPLTGNVRIGSKYTYTEETTASVISGQNQFYGKFLEFFVAAPTASYSSYSTINTASYQDKHYSAQWISGEDISVNSFGKAEFDISCSNFFGRIDNDIFSIASNKLEIFYPNPLSSPEIDVYVSGYNYGASPDGSLDTVFQSRYQLDDEQSLSWLNNRSLENKYLKFEIEMRAFDAVNYPPVFKGMRISTYPIELYNSSSYMLLNEDIRVYCGTDNKMVLPELSKTPTIYLTSNSGLNIKNNIFDIKFSSFPTPFDPSNIDGLYLWLDSRFVNGFSNADPQDNETISSWSDISGNGRNAVQSSSSFRPVFARQSLNLLTINQSNGAESGSINLFVASGANILSVSDVAVSGLRSIRVRPTGSQRYSYIQTSSFGGLGSYMFGDEIYTAVGTIVLDRVQETPSTDARKIIAYVRNGGTLTAYPSSQAPNQVGTTSLSVTFTVPNTATEVFIRYHNGASATNERVFWDNMGVYSGSLVSGSAVEWRPALDIPEDIMSVKFDGSNDNLIVQSASVLQPMTIYAVSRSFGRNRPIFGNNSSATFPTLYSASSGSFVITAGASAVFSTNSKRFQLITAIIKGASSSVFLNASPVFSGDLGSNNMIGNLVIGGGRINPSGASANLAGDIATILIYSGSHSSVERNLIQPWLMETWGIS